MTEELYILPSTFLHNEPVDDSNARYLNRSHPSNLSLVKDVLDIQPYGGTYFSSLYLTVPPKFDYARDTLQFIHPTQPITFPFIVKLSDESNTVPLSSVTDTYLAIIVESHTLHALSLIHLDLKMWFLFNIFIPAPFIQGGV